jgi:hypothetical protein
MSRNTKGLLYIAAGAAALLYAAAVIYGDIMFIQVVGDAFPDTGLLASLSLVGALVTAGSALILPLALHFWFSPGLQFWWGLIYWLADIAALAMNSMLAYKLATGQPLDGPFASWRDFSPATPLLAVLGWGLVFMFDQSHTKRHAMAEMEADQVDEFNKQLRIAAKSDEVFGIIHGAAVDSANRYARDVLSQWEKKPHTNGKQPAATPMRADGATEVPKA